MSAVLTGLWGVAAVLWLVTTPRALRAVAVADAPDRARLPGRTVSAVAWLAFPVCVGVAVASLVGAHPRALLGLLPLAAVVLFGLGVAAQRVGTRVAAGRDRRLPPVPARPPLDLADEAPPRWTRTAFERLDDDARAAVLADLARRALAVWRTFLATTPGGSVSYAAAARRPGRSAPSRQQVSDAVAYRALCDVHRGTTAGRPEQTRRLFDRDLDAVTDGRLVVPERARHALVALHALHDLRFGARRPPDTRRDQEWRLVEHAYAALPTAR